MVRCVACGADCTAAFAFEVRTATGAVAAAWGNGLAQAIAYVDKLESTMLCTDCSLKKRD
jgi:hypothetical protein